MKKIVIIILGIFISLNLVEAQSDSLFNYFLKGNVGTQSVLQIETGSGVAMGREYYEIVKKDINCDTPEIQIKNYTEGIGTSASVIYKVKSYNDTSYSELAEELNVSRFIKARVAELRPMWLPIPAKLKVGDTLIGYKLIRHYSHHDIVTRVKHRIVEGIDTVSCSAGIFKCVKISYTIEAKTSYGLFISQYTDWLNKDVGIVKQEARTKSGRIENIFILKKITKK